jgi:hypothetical protein
MKKQLKEILLTGANQRLALIYTGKSYTGATREEAILIQEFAESNYMLSDFEFMNKIKKYSKIIDKILRKDLRYKFWALIYDKPKENKIVYKQLTLTI